MWHEKEVKNDELEELHVQVKMQKNEIGTL